MIGIVYHGDYLYVCMAEPLSDLSVLTLLQSTTISQPSSFLLLSVKMAANYCTSSVDCKYEQQRLAP